MVERAELLERQALAGGGRMALAQRADIALVEQPARMQAGRRVIRAGQREVGFAALQTFLQRSVFDRGQRPRTCGARCLSAARKGTAMARSA